MLKDPVETVIIPDVPGHVEGPCVRRSEAAEISLVHRARQDRNPAGAAFIVLSPLSPRHYVASAKNIRGLNC
jgi:hypothetical protein